MTKRYDEPIEVTTDGGGSADGVAPIAFRWRGRSYEVDLPLSSWREGEAWWDGARRVERDWFRVLARPAGQLASGDLDPDGFMPQVGAVFDVYRDRYRGSWCLGRVWD